MTAVTALRNTLLQVTTCVSTEEPCAALTFDDGPDPHSTPAILDVLAHYNVKATFFMLGKQALRHPELVEAVAAAGHVVGNHSWDHPSFPTLSRPQRFRQVLACKAALRPYGQRLFRPPYGDQNAAASLDVRLLGYRVVTWNVDGHDWLGLPATCIAQRLAVRVGAGDIVLLHDGLVSPHEHCRDRRPTIEALDQLLHETQHRLRYTTVPILFSHGRTKKELWYRCAEQRTAPPPGSWRFATAADGE